MNRCGWRTLRWTLGGLLVAAHVLTGPQAASAGDGSRAAGEGLFPFVIPWDDATPGTATDASALNTAPAGSSGFILARDGHFVHEKDGARV